MSTTVQNESVDTSVNHSQWLSLLKALASFSGDLASFSAPAFIQSPISLVESSSYWTEHPSLFLAPAAEEEPKKRAYLVLKWYLSTLNGQFARKTKFGSKRKPLNPFLGELFLGRFDDETWGTTELIAEQVSHHPPITAFSVSNHRNKVFLNGWYARRATFKGTIVLKQTGYSIYSIPALNETYLISLPNARAEGLLAGAPYPELTDTSYITSSTGFTAKIRYNGKGWLSGKKNRVIAILYPTSDEKSILYTISGQWSGALDIRYGPSNTPVTETLHPESIPATRLTVKPLEQQDELESRRAWAEVAAAIAAGDMRAVNREKSKLENAQRELRRKEKADGREWQTRYFSKVATEPVLEELGPRVGLSVEDFSETDMWKLDLNKVARVESANA